VRKRWARTKRTLEAIWRAVQAAARRLGAVLAREVDAGTLVFIVGLSALGYGCWLIFRPAGFIVVGVLLVWCTLPFRPQFIVRVSQKEANRDRGLET
jgi:hypothetical protein